MDEASVLDMIRAAKEALGFISGKDRDQFLNDKMLQRAVERCLEIVGEAAKRVGDDYKTSHTGVPWRKAAGLRDVISHQYNRIDAEQIWLTLEEAIPDLIATLEPLIGEESGGD